MICFLVIYTFLIELCNNGCFPILCKYGLFVPDSCHPYIVYFTYKCGFGYVSVLLICLHFLDFLWHLFLCLPVNLINEIKHNLFCVVYIIYHYISLQGLTFGLLYLYSNFNKDMNCLQIIGKKNSCSWTDLPRNRTGVWAIIFGATLVSAVWNWDL